LLHILGKFMSKLIYYSVIYISLIHLIDAILSYENLCLSDTEYSSVGLLYALIYISKLTVNFGKENETLPQYI
jgi:hypothetical protein